MRVLVLPHEPPRRGRLVYERAHPSRPDCRTTMLAEVGGILAERGWVGDADRDWLRLCLDEAITNAMYHGNEGDPRLNVLLALSADDQRWTLLVTDEGDGFPASAIRAIDDAGGLMLEHGRGISIMDSWLDELAYYRGGRCALLARRLMTK